MFSLKKSEALKQIKTVVGVVDDWKQHFKSWGVTRGDIESYAEQIDRSFLLDQRAEYHGRTHK